MTSGTLLLARELLLRPKAPKLSNVALSVCTQPGLRKPHTVRSLKLWANFCRMSDVNTRLRKKFPFQVETLHEVPAWEVFAIIELLKSLEERGA